MLRLALRLRRALLLYLPLTRWLLCLTLLYLPLRRSLLLLHLLSLHLLLALSLHGLP